MTTYEPVTDSERLLASFGVSLPQRDDTSPEPDIGAMGRRPFIVRIERAEGAERAERIAHKPPDSLGEARWGTPGMRPRSASGLGQARLSDSCGAETMKSNPAFRESWWAGRRCIIPAESILQWCYDTGRPQRWAISLRGGGPMALAGLWSEGTDADGERVPSFGLLTLNADGHEVFARMDAPDHEKRMPVILAPTALTLWLYGSLKDAERLLVPCPAQQLCQSPQEAPSRVRREPRSWASVPDMFAYEWHMTAAELPSTRTARSPRSGPPASAPTQRNDLADLPGPTTASLF